MSSAEQQIEQEIQGKGLNAPRLTPEYIDSKIKGIEYILARDVCKRDNGVEIFDAPASLQTLTFCVITLENGFTVTGESACASPENFNAEIGKKIAFQNAREKIWQLEGYLLKERLYQQPQVIDGELPVPTAVNCGEARGTVGEAKSCLDSVSHLNKNYHNIGLLLEILRTTNVGIDVTGKAHAKLSKLVDNI